MRRIVVLAGLALTLLVASGCVMPDQMSQLQKDVADVQQQLRGIQREQQETQSRLASIESGLQGGDAVTRTEFADVRLQLDQVARDVAMLDERINDSNARVDRLSHDVQQARELARRRAALSPRSDEPPTGGEPSGAAGEPGDAVPSAGPAALPNPEALYNAAYADFSKGNFALAVSGFEEYVTRYPESDLADNALYWIGECHFSQGSFSRAVEAFDRMLGRYPESDRAAAADLKKGLAFLEQNQVGKAIVQLKHVLGTYPGSDEARIARDKLASLGAAVR